MAPNAYDNNNNCSIVLLPVLLDTTVHRCCLLQNTLTYLLTYLFAYHRWRYHDNEMCDIVSGAKFSGTKIVLNLRFESDISVRQT